MSPAWWKPTTPEHLVASPWISAEAKRAFGMYLKPTIDVLEYGSGGSTLWLQERVHSVVSVEHDRVWYRALKKKVDKEKVTMMLWDQPEPPEFEQLFDLVFLDGEPIERRGAWIKALGRLVKPHGVVVLDNANRHEYEVERQWMNRHTILLASIKGKGGTFTLTEFFEWRG